MFADLSTAIEHPGPWAILLACFAGPYLFPAAGELAIVAGVGLGVAPWVALAVGLIGSLASDQLAYGIGRAGGARIARRMLLPDRRAQLEQRLHQHAVVALVPGRMLPGARTWVAVLAGAARLPWRRFALLNLAGCVLWTSVFVAIGALFGAAADTQAVVREVEHLAWPIFGVVLALGVARVAYVSRRRRTPPEG